MTGERKYVMNFRSSKKRYEKEREAALKKAMDQMDPDIDQDEEDMSEAVFRHIHSGMEDENETDTVERSGTEDIAYEVASFIAVRASEHFFYMTEGVSTNSIMAMLCIIEYSDPHIAVTLLKAMFYANGMENAAMELDIIVSCSCHCDDICEMFIESFMESDVIDHLFMESILEVS